MQFVKTIRHESDFRENRENRENRERAGAPGL